MSEPESQNGHQPVPESEPEPNPQPETEPVPPAEAQTQTQTKLEPESESGSGPDPAVNDVDLRETAIQSNDADGNPSPKPQLRKDEGSRTFTMRELLNGLKTDSEPEREDANSHYRLPLFLHHK